MKDRWYILWALHPLEAKKHCELLLEAYNRDHQSQLQLVFRTPSEFVSDTRQIRTQFSREARSFLFRYVFVQVPQGTFNQLDAFLRYRVNGDLEVRLIGRRAQWEDYTIKDIPLRRIRIEAPALSDTEVTRFFRFCEAYMQYTQNRHVPFIDFTPELAQQGDKATVIDGPYKDQQVLVQPDPHCTTTLTDEQGHTCEVPALKVLTTWFQTVAVPVIIPYSYLRMERPARYNQRFHEFDEFFDFFSLPDSRERLQSGRCLSTDIAKARRMLDLAQPHPEQRARSQRLSRKLQAFHLAALIVSCHILGRTQPKRQYYAQWQQVYSQFHTPSQLTQQAQLVAWCMEG